MAYKLCGCSYYTFILGDVYKRSQINYLPLLDSSAHSTILSTTSSTALKQTFTNPTTDPIKQCVYSFPLYDGVSVVSFTCRIGKKVLTGVVKEKAKAKKIFDDAVAKGETAGLLEQTPESADVFTTKLGNIPAGQSIVVEITYVGELKHTETEGIRFTIPTSIAPRYGSGPAALSNVQPSGDQGIKITVDVNMPEGSFIKSVQSPSHPIAVSMGTISTALKADPTMSKASATLSLGAAALEKDFVLIVASKDVGIPKALLETHPTIPNHRALMATLVPKFSLPPSRPEIVFVADRSGSMAGSPMTMLISAMDVLLKSMPLGVKFNICSFGSTNSFLWSKSKAYSAETLAEASTHVKSFTANMGGTETFAAIKHTIEKRFTDIPLEVILLTDGDIWSQDTLFQYLNQQVQESNGNIRVFPLGIGNGVSHSLIEGLARAGNGFASAVQSGERLDTAVVRMLRGALSPHITDYTLEVKFQKQDDDFEVVERVTEGMRVLLSEDAHPEPPKTAISLFDEKVDPEKDSIKDNESPYAHLPEIPYPHLHQAPHKIPTLFAFSRTSVYLLLSPETIQRNPTSVVLRATSAHGPLVLEIPIEIISEPGTTIHQLAAKKAVQDLEEGRGWIYDAKDQNGKFIKERYPSCFQELVEKEAVRLGEKFQIAGKWTSFVAVSANDKTIKAAKKAAEKVKEAKEESEEDEIVDGKEKRRRNDNNSKTHFMDVDAEVDEDKDDEDYAEAANSSVGPVIAQDGAQEISAAYASARGRGESMFRKVHIDSVIQRGEKIDAIAARTDRLAESSQQFYKGAKKSQAMRNPFAGAVAGVTNLFGNSNSRATSSAPAPAPAFGQAAPSVFGGFGAPAAAQAFRQTAPSGSGSSSPFGAPAAPSRGGGGLFGSRSSSPTSTRQSAGLFGGPVGAIQSDSSAPQQSRYAPGSMAPQPTGGLFGGLGNTAPPPPTGGLFGSPSSSSIPQQPSRPLPGAGLFGSNVNTPELRSNRVQQQSLSGAPAPSSTLFGGQQQQQQQSLLSAPPPPAAPSASYDPTIEDTTTTSSSFSIPQPLQVAQNIATYDPPSSESSKKSKKSVFSTRGSSSLFSFSKQAEEAQVPPTPPTTNWKTKTPTERLLALISLQDFSGSWTTINNSNTTAEISEILGFEIPPPPKELGVDEQTWITMVVIKVLEEKMAAEEGTWGLIVEKARGWLEGLQWGGEKNLNVLEREAAEVVERGWVGV